MRQKKTEEGHMSIGTNIRKLRERMKDGTKLTQDIRT